MTKKIHLSRYSFALIVLLSPAFCATNGTNTVDQNIIEAAQKRTESHSLVDNQWIDIIKTIKKNPARAREQTQFGWTILHEAARQAVPSSKTKEGKELINYMTGKTATHSPVPAELETAQKPTIQQATQHLDQIAASSVIPLLLANGLSVNSKNQDLTTPLHVAARFDRSGEATKQLLKSGAALMDQDSVQKTPLHHAAQNNNTTTIKLLLDEAKKQNLLTTLLSAQDLFGKTALHYAAEDQTPDNAQLLLKTGTSLQAQDNDGNTPLHLAADKGHPKTVAFLLRKGASAKAQNKAGKTPAHLAANKSPAIKDSKIYIREQWKTIEAPTNDYLDCLRLLYKKDRSCLTISDASGKIPLDYATSKNNQEAIKFLQKPNI